MPHGYPGRVASDVAVGARDPFTATGVDERQAVYAELGRHAAARPGVLPDGRPAWLVTGYAEARAALADPRLVKVFGPIATLIRRLAPEASPALHSHLLFVDGADHARLRRLVGAAFTRRRVEDLEPRIRRIADDLLDSTVPGGETDLVEAYAYRLPMTVICELLGVPEDLRDEFGEACAAVSAGSFSEPDSVVAAARECMTLARCLVDRARAAPGEDLLSALVAARDRGDSLSDDELTSMLYLLIAAGHETTVSLIGNAVLALLTHPDQIATLQSRPELLADAIEELLRFDSPVQATFPLAATEPVDLGGAHIAAGDVVVPVILAADRDPRHVHDPHERDLTRGHVPRMRLAVPPADLRRHPSVILHALVSLPVVLDPITATGPGGHQPNGNPT